MSEHSPRDLLAMPTHCAVSLIVESNGYSSAYWPPMAGGLLRLPHHVAVAAIARLAAMKPSQQEQPR